MHTIFIFTFINFLLYFCFGSIFLNQKLNKKNDYTDIITITIFGIIAISSLAVLINFFFPLNKNTNSFLYLIIVIVSLKYIFKSNNIKIIKTGIIISLFSTLFLIYSNTYRPDAGLYHLPFTGILNNEKIIFGLSNIHFRFAHTSILQYLSAVNYNYLFGLNGIELSKSLFGLVLISFFIFNIIKNKKNTLSSRLNLLFSYLVTIYIGYKFIRFSEYGNDTIPHLLYFFMISYILNNIEKINFKNISKIFLLCSFLFLSKVTFILSYVFLLPFIKKIFTEFKFNKYIIVGVLLILMGFIKSYIMSGCLIYPIEISCHKSSSIYDSELTKKVSLETEAWSKAWPDRINKDIKMNNYTKKFNWIKAYKNTHLKKIIKIMVPYLIFLILLVIFLKFKTKEKFIQKNVFNNYFDFMIVVNFIFILIWFLKFPTYRFGTSFIVTSICLFILKFTNIKILDKISDYKSFFCILLVVVFSAKQFQRLIKNNTYEKNTLWPNIYSENKLYNKVDTPIVVNKKIAYYETSNRMCFYRSYICTNYKVGKNIIYKRKNGYKFFISK